MASQRHKLTIQNVTAAGEIIAEGEIAPGYLLQLENPDTGFGAYGGPLTGSPLQEDIPLVEVPAGAPGGPLQGSTLAGPVPESITPPDPNPEPEPGTIVITSPTEGATVPPVHDITGTGALPDAEVELWYAGQDPGEDPPASTTTADGDGNWGFTGDTPAALGPVTWGVFSEGSLATVSITVVEDGGLERTGDRTFPLGPFNIVEWERDDANGGYRIEVDPAGVVQDGDTVKIEASGSTDVNGEYPVTVQGTGIFFVAPPPLKAPTGGRLTVVRGA